MADEDDIDFEAALDESLAEIQSQQQNNNNNNNNANNNTTNDIQNRPNPTNHSNDIQTNDAAIIEEALNAVDESNTNASNAQQTQNNDIFSDPEMKDFFTDIMNTFQQIDDSDDTEKSLDNALKGIMGKFFDAESLKEPVAAIVEKYPKWLAENKSKVTEKEYKNYFKQYQLYKSAHDLLQQNNSDNNKVFELLLETFQCGSIPVQVLDGMMPSELLQFTNILNNLGDDLTNEEEKVMEQTKRNKKSQKNENNQNSTNDDVKESESKNNNNNNNNNDNNKDADVNIEEMFKMFESMMSNNTKSEPNQNQNQNQNQSNNNNANNNNNNNNNFENFKPTMDDLPKLSPEEMKQFKQLMQKDCILM